MIRRIEVEQAFCDFCGGECSQSDSCRECGRHICWRCRDNPEIGVSYQHSALAPGYRDGYYCRGCDEQLTQNADPLHDAYHAMRALRLEAEEFNHDWEKRVNACEAKIKEFFDQASKIGQENPE